MMGFLSSVYPTDLDSNMPFHDMVMLSFIIAVCCWILSVFTKEYSWIDRTWSIAPVMYVSYIAWFEGFQNTRLNAMALLVTLWGLRLTYNFARKGGFTYDPSGKSEDYRWAVLKDKMGPFWFQIFNATFIAPYQSLLILWFSSPIHAAWINKETPFGLLDLGVSAIFILLLVGETKADEEMWKFQEDKRRRLENSEDISDRSPFYREGLYRFSRHPNYFCEVGMWWTFYLFSITSNAKHTLLHWTGIGALMLTLLIDGSLRFGESISASKYPTYIKYQSEVSRFIPWFPRRLPIVEGHKTK